MASTLGTKGASKTAHLARATLVPTERTLNSGFNSSRVYRLTNQMVSVWEPPPKALLSCKTHPDPISMESQGSQVVNGRTALVRPLSLNTEQ